MRHHNSLYLQLLRFLPWQRFDQLVDDYRADRRVRRQTTKSQFTALLCGRLAGVESLREIEGALASHANRLHHLGAAAPARSTLADANANRSAQLFADLFAILPTQAAPGLRRTTRGAIHRVDATTIRLTEPARAWADYEAHGVQVKLHVDFDAGVAIPANFAITPARVNDVIMARDMPIEAGVFRVRRYTALHERRGMERASLRMKSRKQSSRS